jgi:demethylmenaquinone methyltransferase/2-methoxy-6-polyprenyl-1,4-benzoquinol methylase
MTGPPGGGPRPAPVPVRGETGFERDVQAMFAELAPRYDWFNHLNTFGQDLLWRPQALWALDRHRGTRPVARILDVGCGPGELTRLAARHYPGSRAVGADLTSAMLRLAERERPESDVATRTTYLRADAQRLPFAEAAFDLVLSAFVVRNLPDLPRALREFRRVLRPGGSLLTLEITEPPNPVVRSLFHAYFDRVVPMVGAAFGNAGPSRYLPESLKHLPGRTAMFAEMEGAGFVRPEASLQSFGIVTAYLAEVPGAPSSGR